MTLGSRRIPFILILSSLLLSSLVSIANEEMSVDLDQVKSSVGSEFKASHFFTAVSYSLFSPTFETEAIKKQNQESLGLSALAGFSYLPLEGWGFQAQVGLLQNAQTDKSLPDFILIKPAIAVSLSVSKLVYLTAGIFNYSQQGNSLKNFRSQPGQEFFLGFKMNKNMNLLMGYTYAKFSSDFVLGNSAVNSIVAVRGIESQFVYLF